MTPARLYHNPSCSKSRGALELLREHGIEPELVRYLETPPGIEELRAIVRKLGRPVRDLVRAGEPDYAALGLDDPSVDDGMLLAALAEHPRLIERPVFVMGDRAVIGRPPERVLDLLGGQA